MNKEWSAKNKQFQQELKKNTFSKGIQTLLELRKELFEVVEEVMSHSTKEELCAMPFVNANGYHNKTIAYSIWHIFRIEDIVCNTILQEQEQVLFQGFLGKIHSPIITTGNELVKEEIADFSRKLDMEALFEYAKEVKRVSDQYLQSLEYTDLKRKVIERKEAVIESGCVSESELSYWLIDYWCGKDVKGLLQMPFSRHWIMHIEALLRIQKGLI